MRSYSCPTCRAPVWQVLRDPEYASVIGAEITSSMAASSADIVSAPGGRGLRTVQVPGPAGITIGTTISSDSSGAHRRCAVTKVVRGDGAYRAGIRAGDVILSVNGTQVHDHAIAVECIERRCRIGDCQVEVKTPSHINEMRSTFRSLTTTLRGGAATAALPVTRVSRRRTPSADHLVMIANRSRSPSFE